MVHWSVYIGLVIAWLTLGYYAISILRSSYEKIWGKFVSYEGKDKKPDFNPAKLSHRLNIWWVKFWSYWVLIILTTGTVITLLLTIGVLKPID
jgi:hypothetical protein